MRCTSRVVVPKDACVIDAPLMGGVGTLGFAKVDRCGEKPETPPCSCALRSDNDISRATPVATRTPEVSMSQPAPRVISVALIEDNRLVRQGISTLLKETPDLEVVAAWSSGETSSFQDAKPDVVLLDLGLRNGDSLRVAQRVKVGFPDSKIILMDLLPVHEDIVEFVHVGVSGFIMKDATLEDLVATIRSVVAGANVLPQAMTKTLFSQIASDAVAKGRPAALKAVRMTPREREVIGLIAEGLSNKEIASQLHIATHTVKSHVRNIMEKLALHTRLQIAAFAHREEAP